MGVRNKKRKTIRRLDSKTLDARSINESRNGLNCSPFEAETVLEGVKEVYFPFLNEQSVKAPPSKVTLVVFLLRRGKALVQQYLDLISRTIIIRMRGRNTVNTCRVNM